MKLKRPTLLAFLFLIVLHACAQKGGRQMTTNASLTINKTLVTPNPSDGARRLYQFLYDNYGKRVISGVMTLSSFDETNWLKANTGKEPALVGLDFMHSGRNYNWYNDRQPVIDAKSYYERNGIPALCWHWRDPSKKTEAFYTKDTSFDVSKVFDTTSTEYKAMIADIDYISGLLLELRDNNVPVIWRPLHEAAGGWFWWGAKGSAPCKKLYQIMFDRMVNHHGLNNLIWVWTREPNDDAWYPGDAFVDIVGRDIYKEGDHSSQFPEWSDMNQRYGKQKMVTISECGSFPDPDNLVKDVAKWSWFMPWYGQFVRDSKFNSLSLWKKAFDHPYVITLDEMPDLKTYEEAPEDEVTSTDDTQEALLNVYPTVVEDHLFIESTIKFLNVILYSPAGNIILTHRGTSGRIAIDVSGLKSGIYFVKVDGLYVKKIFKN